jgi:plastocyanin
MSKNILFLIIAVVIIAGGWFLFGGYEPIPPSSVDGPPFTGKLDTNAPEGPPTIGGPTAGAPGFSNKTVSYTNNGYEPRETRIAVGENVRFVNNSNDDVWTASGPHPAHTNFPAFDEKQESVPGTSYSFTFTEKGTWRYHNHLNPGHTGTIVVE